MELAALGIKPNKKKQFESRGISSVEELLSFLPRKYKDFSQITGILPSDQVSCLRARVTNVSSKNAGKVPYVSADCVEFPSGKPIHVIWFRSMWIYSRIRSLINKSIVVVGKVDYSDKFGYSIVQPEVFDYETALGIYPVYRSIPGMSTEYLQEKMQAALNVGLTGSEIIPEDIVDREGELPMPVALRYIHTPQTIRQSEEGMNRILLNDLLYFALHNELNKAEISKGSQYNIKSISLMNAVKSALPYQLTVDQEKAVDEMVRTARDGRRLQSLVLGDVGSGKTVTAALVAAAFIGSGYQVVMMAPTQVLAKQHLASFREMMEPHGVQIAYLDSTLKAKERREVLKSIVSGEAQLVIGTHACIAGDVVYSNLALTVVDEEHKFGVKQRAAIVEKAAAGVHSITMSATPIPRSLAQVIYGDNVQLHTIKTMPLGRKPVITGIAKDPAKVFRFLASEAKKGHQAYVVCPMIDANDENPDVGSVETVSEEYRKVLEPLGVSVETLTGKDSKARTEDVIERFKSRDIDILIATTVIEVGVNVPNATTMVVTNAERFGLSQLHQLRGRVGRGDLQSYCVLRSDTQDDKALERLNALCQTTDGFKIAEADLKLRGAGDFLGTQQSGNNKYVMLMLGNPERYKTAVRLAKELIDRGMSCCKLTQKVEEERQSGSGT